MRKMARSSWAARRARGRGGSPSRRGAQPAARGEARSLARFGKSSARHSAYPARARACGRCAPSRSHTSSSTPSKPTPPANSVHALQGHPGRRTRPPHTYLPVLTQLHCKTWCPLRVPCDLHTLPTALRPVHVASNPLPASRWYSIPYVVSPLNYASRSLPRCAVVPVGLTSRRSSTGGDHPQLCSGGVPSCGISQVRRSLLRVAIN